MQQFTLPRTGLPPVQFKGEIMASATDPLPPFPKAKADRRRWHELKLVRHEDQRLILAIGYRTGVQSEVNIDIVELFDSETAMIDFLTNEYDPTEHMDRLPEHLRNAASRQQRMDQRVIDDFEARCSLLLTRAGIVEEI
ncbi:MAG: hypothetical protein CMJ78_25540 [Planctomycetaceae bacterium]|nr:hypothetical protein [Planctomycetaceae bacterium]